MPIRPLRYASVLAGLTSVIPFACGGSHAPGASLDGPADSSSPVDAPNIAFDGGADAPNTAFDGGADASNSTLSCGTTDLAFSDVDVGELRLHVGCAGNGPVVVLLHGYPEYFGAWQAVGARLVAQGYRVVVPDQRGYDLSDKPADISAYGIDHMVRDLEGLVTATGAPRVLLVGHDWGGTVSWIFAHRDPQRLRGLVVLAGPHPDIWGHPEVDPIQAMAENAYVPRLAGPLGEAAFAAFDALLSPYMDAGQLSDYHAAWNQPGAKVAMNDWYRANLYPDASLPTGVDVDVPTLVMWGGADTFATASEIPLLPQYVHHLDVVTWPDAGHFVDLDPALTDEIAARIVAFDRATAP
jgi:pimeloyl-ACP methyl ester carboxylesterase